jgi:hypothetical protein
LVEIRNALEARVQELRATALEYEGTIELRRLQSRHDTHRRMQESLKSCRQDVAMANKMFQKALNLQAVAARSNAMAGGANLGQAIGGRGGRGIGQSPGERLLQIRRNQATKQSIEMATEAADKLNTAQNRLNNDLRVHFPVDMAGVGIIEVPDLWKGVSILLRLGCAYSLCRLFIALLNQKSLSPHHGRTSLVTFWRDKPLETLAMPLIRGAPWSWFARKQEQQLLVVNTKLDGATDTLSQQVFTEEKKILNGIIEAAKKIQTAQGIEAY